MNMFLVFLGGGAGSVFRYLVSLISLKYYSGVYPIATFASNLLSCLVLVVVVEMITRSGMNENHTLRHLILVGFCGGFSTFSTFSFETVQLIKNGNPWVAAGNVALSVVVCSILIYKLTK